jgi:hypothetical protein
MEVHGLFEKLVGNPRDFPVANRPLRIQHVGITREITQREVNVDPRFRACSESDR